MGQLWPPSRVWQAMHWRTSELAINFFINLEGVILSNSVAPSRA